MRKGNGGIIGPLNNPTQTVAAGIWSMDEQQQSLGARQWPGTPAASKPNPPSFATSCVFTASISGATMTVSAISSGALAVGQVISGGTTGNFVSQYTIITAQLTGTTGSTGTYTVSIGQTVLSTNMSSTVVITSVTSSTSSVQVPFITGYDGGSPITSITAKVYLGSSVVGTASGTTSPITVTSLPNNTVYSVTLTATNAIGTSTASSGPYFQTPAVPSTPTIGAATLAGTVASVAFTPSANNNGSTITTYTATSSPGGVTGTSTTSPISVSGLAGTTTYTFTVTATNAIGVSAASAASNSVTTPALSNITYLIAAGGGGGSFGGGGAGGYLAGTFTASPGSPYTVTVGTGGAGNVGTAGVGFNGLNSSVFGFTAIGGGGGGEISYGKGAVGGSGGGHGSSSLEVANGAAGTAGQGNAGGNNGFAADGYPGAGGGGAGAVGGTPPSVNQGGAGGIGVANTISGSSVYYAGGGGGCMYNSKTAGGLGGSGGGGNGGNGAVNGGTGTANTGGGGGGGGNGGTGGTGGIGVVILRATAAAASTTGSPTLTRSGGSTGDYIYTFTGSGSITY